MCQEGIEKVTNFDHGPLDRRRLAVFTPSSETHQQPPDHHNPEQFAKQSDYNGRPTGSEGQLTFGLFCPNTED